jgi:outer membrane protein OmpA-like peptidoglycan-associated protein
MRKLLPLLLSIALIIWLIGGTLWYKRNYCDMPQPQTPTPTFALQEGNDIVFQTTPLLFSFGDARPMFLSESISSLKKAADYLNTNIDKALVIKGLYSAKEKKLKPSVDLGLSRAESIKAVLVNLGASTEVVETASGKNENLHFINNQLIDGVELSIIENPTVKFQPLNIYFNKNKYQFAETTELQQYFQNLKKYMIINPNAQVQVIAYNSKGEKLKIKKNRLDYVKHYLTIKNLDSQQFVYEKSLQRNKQNVENDVKNQRIEIRVVVP